MKMCLREFQIYDLKFLLGNLFPQNFFGENFLGKIFPGIFFWKSFLPGFFQSLT